MSSGRDPHGPSALVGRPLGDLVMRACLVEARGAWLFEARDGRNRRALVQWVPLRPMAPGEERAQVEMIRSVEAYTFELAADLEVKVEDHGFDPSVGDGGAFYWRLPWTGASDRCGRTRLELGEDLLAATMSLLDRLAARHPRGRLDPLLQASLVIPRTGGADLLGAPVAVPDEWLAAAVAPPPRAPEERSTGEVRASGDLWRLGRALRELSATLEPPLGFSDFLARLEAADPGRRVASASDALVELEASRGTLAGQTLAGQTLAGSTADELIAAALPPPPTGGLGRTALEAPESASAGQGPTWTDPPPDDLDGPPIDPAIKPRAAGADEAPTMWMKREDLAAGRRSASEENFAVAGAKATVVGVRLGAEIAAPDATNAPPTRVFDDPASKSPGVGPGGTLAGAPVPFVLGPGGTIAAELPAFRGPGGTVSSERSPALLGPGGTVAAEPLPQLPPRPRPPSRSPVPDAPDSPLRRTAPPSGRSVLTLMLLAALAVASGAAVQLLKPMGEATFGTTRVEGSGSALGPKTVTPWNDVLLEASPAGAEFVGERDGRLLGPGPVRLLVPSDLEVAVLVTAPGHEPIRLILPSRGRVTVHLASTEGTSDCPVSVRAPGNQPLQVVGLDLPSTPAGDYSIPGAVVMRSVEGLGAWLVRCQTFGGQKEHRFAARSTPRTIQLNVLEPRTARLSVEGRPSGQLPTAATANAGFVFVEAEDEQEGKVGRWVPAFSDTSAQLPRPTRVRRSGS